MTKTEPPIELLKTALENTPRQLSKSEGFFTRWYDNPAYIALEAAIKAMGECKCGYCTTCQQPKPEDLQREIRVVDEIRKKLLAFSDKWDVYDIMEIVKPYLATREPVSVDLDAILSDEEKVGVIDVTDKIQQAINAARPEQPVGISATEAHRIATRNYPEKNWYNALKDDGYVIVPAASPMRE